MRTEIPENNPYTDDLKDPDPIRQLRAYVHDVDHSIEDPFSGSFRDDVEDLLNLCRTIMEANRLDPSEYTDQYDRGGEPLEEEED